MKKLLAVFVAAVMLFGIFGGALAQPAKRAAVSTKTAELTERRETVKAEKAEDKAPVVNVQPDVTKKVAVKDDEPDLNTALNASGGTLTFTNDANYPWEVVVEGDRVYARSTNVGVSSSEASVTTTVTVPAGGGIVSFDFEAWGEGSSDSYDWDNCRFFIDDTMIFRYGAHQIEWEHYEGVIDEGTHTLTWTYKKDGSVNPTGDYFKLDNVRVGAPIAVESISAPASINVPLYRSAAIEYTVLPADASNKAVTFTSADETIATVNEAGKVTSVSIGTTTVTIASVAYPNVTATVNVNVYDAGFTTVTFYGDITFDPDEVLMNQWVTFTDADPTTLTVVGNAPDTYGMAYAYGTVYGYTQDGVFFGIPFADIANSTNYVTGTSVFNGTMRSMSIDYSSGILYGIGSVDNGGTSVFGLYAIDMSTGLAELIGTVNYTVLAFAIDINGTAYAIASNGNLYTVNLGTAALNLVGSTGLSVSYVQDMCFDYDTGDLYWAHCNDTDGDLIRIDPADASIEILGNVGPGDGCEVVGLFTVPVNEPAPPTNIPVAGITIMPDEATIRVNETVQLSAAITPVNADNKEVEWTSNNENVAVVDQNGFVLAIAPGIAKITATTVDGGFSDSATITVLDSLGTLRYGWYFETDPIAEGWEFVDKNADGKNWNWQSSASSYAYEGTGVISSDSYSGGAITPDNWAVTPQVKLPDQSATFSFFARGRTSTYYDEHFQVYIGTTADVDSMTAISPEEISAYAYQQFMYDVSAYAGQTVYFAIRHFNCNDVFTLYVDQVEIFGKGDISGTHTLTINYQYEDGTEAAPVYEAMVFEGAEYSVNSPMIDGYIADPAVVTGTVGNADITVTVVYHPDPNVLFQGYYFETDPANEGWTFVDNDGDGNNFMWSYNYGGDGYDAIAYEGTGYLISESFVNNFSTGSGAAVTPDNYAVSPAVILPTDSAYMTFYATSVGNYGYEHISVYVGNTPDIASMNLEMADTAVAYNTMTGDVNYGKYIVDLSDYVGQTVYVAINHSNCTDIFLLGVDQVEFFGAGEFAGAHTLTVNYQYADGTEAAPAFSTIVAEGLPYSVTSPVIDGYIADVPVVEGTMGAQDITVTVTYTSDGSYIAAGWYFETDPAADGWIFIDSDGDGFNWIWQQDYSNPPYCTAYEGEGLIYSESYNNDTDTALSPDNWAISPAVALPTGTAEVFLYAQGQDSQGWDAEVFAIYAGTTPNIEDMVKVSDDYVTQYGYQKFTADLTAFAGETVYIAIRHYNVTDMFMLDVDNVVVKGMDGDVPAGLPGDVDLDGRITFSDISVLYMYMLGLTELSDQALANADFNGDDAINYVDITDLNMYLLSNG